MTTTTTRKTTTRTAAKPEASRAARGVRRLAPAVAALALAPFASAALVGPISRKLGDWGAMLAPFVGFRPRLAIAAPSEPAPEARPDEGTPGPTPSPAASGDEAAAPAPSSSNSPAPRARAAAKKLVPKHGLLVRREVVAKAVGAGARPVGHPVGEDATHPAGFAIDDPRGAAGHLAAGDVITEIEGRRIHTVEDVIVAVGGAAAARPKTISGRMWRKGELWALTVEMPW